MIVNGEMDEYPENAFFNVGTIDDVIEKSKKEADKRVKECAYEPATYIWTGIYASNRQFYVGRGESITFPVEDGQMQVLPHHEDMIAAIVPGEMDFVDANGEKITVAVSAGFTEVFNNRIKVFALTVERPEGIDLRRAESERAGRKTGRKRWKIQRKSDGARKNMSKA